MSSDLLDDLSYLNKSGKESDYVYVGFWRRVLALIFDWIIVSVFSVPLLFLINHVFFNEVFDSILILVYLYFPLMESSKYQATLGKKIVGAKVINKNGERLGFFHALGRFLLKIISYIILLIGFIMIAFTEKKQGLHDIIASTYVVENRD
jgi:uncharacterized RDD family membrane protein YckC